MKRNITITLEEDLAKEAKVLAAQRDTSVSKLLSEYLKTILKKEHGRLKAKKEFLKLSSKNYVLNYAKRDFQRDALHER
jgi:hypothetical protein